jgi:TonB family protein
MRKFTAIRCIGVSLFLHLSAFVIIYLVIPSRGQQLISINGVYQMPVYNAVLSEPEVVPEEMVKPSDTIAAGGQYIKETSSPDTVALRNTVNYERIKMLNEIVVSTFAKPLPDSIKNTPPVYPEIDRKEGHEGVVILLVDINATGEVTDVKVIQSSGYSLLDQSALDAVRQWRFAAATRNKKPVFARVKIPVRFKLIEEQ